MTWAKLDDRFYSNRKVLRAWKMSRASVGLYAMALTYCASHELDGHVDPEFVEMLMPNQREREQAVCALLEGGLWVENGHGWVVNDYLKYNPSAADLRDRRRRESERKAAARAHSVRPESARSPEGVR